MHRVIQLLNDWGLEIKHKGGKFVFHEKVHVFMSTVFAQKNAKRKKPRKKGPERGMQDGGGGSGLDLLFPPK